MKSGSKKCDLATVCELKFKIKLKKKLKKKNIIKIPCISCKIIYFLFGCSNASRIPAVTTIKVKTVKNITYICLFECNFKLNYKKV